jgi:hypothetical protein
MCGDLEEADSESERFYASFLHTAEAAIHDAIDHRGGSRNCLQAEGDDPDRRISDSSLHRYMDGLFADILNACIKDGRLASEADRYRVLASQSIVLARVAGLLTGRLDPRDNALASSIEALMAGYAPQRYFG